MSARAGWVVALALIAIGCVAQSVPRVVTGPPAIPEVMLAGRPRVYVADGSDPMGAFRQRERALVEGAGATLVEERDASAMPPRPGDLVLRVFAEQPISVGTSWQQTREPFDVRIFDATGVRVEPVLGSDERAARIDTSDRLPLVSAHYEVLIEESSRAPLLDPAQRLVSDNAFHRRVAEQLAVVLLPDLARAAALVRPR